VLSPEVTLMCATRMKAAPPYIHSTEKIRKNCKGLSHEALSRPIPKYPASPSA
jgi:hypothetical protein